jgi:hypothetical protein
MKKLPLVFLLTSIAIGMFPTVALAASPVIPNVDTLSFNGESQYFGTKCTKPKWSGQLDLGKSTSYKCTFKDKSVSMLVMGYSSTKSGNGHGQANFIRTIAKSKSGYESLTYAAVTVGIFNGVDKEIQTWIKNTVPQVKNRKSMTKTFASKKSAASIKITIIGGPGEMRTVEIGSK